MVYSPNDPNSLGTDVCGYETCKTNGANCAIATLTIVIGAGGDGGATPADTPPPVSSPNTLPPLLSDPPAPFDTLRPAMGTTSGTIKTIAPTMPNVVSMSPPPSTEPPVVLDITMPPVVMSLDLNTNP